MDINFPLILVIAVFATGLVALYDWLFLAKKRREALAVVDKQFTGVDRNNEKNQAAYNAARNAATQEPTLVEYSKSFFPVLAVVLILRSFIVEPFQIPSESMVPTLEVGDFILVNKFTYGLRLPVIRTEVIEINEPNRGDVMVFFPPEETRYFIKRVIGIPGDEVVYDRNTLYINGEAVPQTLIREEGALNSREHCSRVASKYQVLEETLGGKTYQVRECLRPSPLSEYAKLKVPEGHYFMMGDNRDNSSDSRYFGMVSEDRIVGKAFAIWMHWDDFLSLPSFSRVGGIK